MLSDLKSDNSIHDSDKASPVDDFKRISAKRLRDRRSSSISADHVVEG